MVSMCRYVSCTAASVLENVVSVGITRQRCGALKEHAVQIFPQNVYDVNSLLEEEASLTEQFCRVNL